ncbi:MAG: hypothetical protein M3R52_13370 [Acidobacteriota bacterium]|nr:hypothetical protein [Acidobacteriota bacterium]
MRLRNLSITLAVFALLGQTGCMFGSAPRNSGNNSNSNTAAMPPNNNSIDSRPPINVGKPGGPRHKPTVSPTP